MTMTPAQRRKARDMFLEAGVWLLFFALLVPAGFVGYVIGRSTSHSDTSARNSPTTAANVSSLGGTQAHSTALKR
jgi:hypothetical protein